MGKTKRLELKLVEVPEEEATNIEDIENVNKSDKLLLYCAKCKRKTDNIDLRQDTTKQGKTRDVLRANCFTCKGCKFSYGKL